MKIKNILSACLVFCGFSVALTSCSNNEEAFFTVTDEDAPRILNTDFPGSGFELNRDQKIQFQVLVTPADMTTVRWYDGDVLAYEGAYIDRFFEAGDYNLKILATTVKGKETYRNIRMVVKALDGDPAVGDDSRLQAPGDAVTMTGSNLFNIKKVKINGREIDVTAATSSSIEYTLPADMADGKFRLSLVDETGQSYGSGWVTIYGDPLITKSDFMGQSEGLVTIPGRKLGDVTSVTVNGVECSIESLTDEQIVIKLPALEEGVYDVKVTNNSGVALKFLQNGTIVDNATIKVSLIAEEILWEGNHPVDWGNIFEKNELAATLKEIAKPRAILRLYVNRTDAEYAKGCAAVNWADIVNGGSDPNRGDVDITFEDTYVDFVLTAKSMELLEQNNFQVVGHGFDLLKITLIQPSEEELWAGSHPVDWGNIWEDDGTITAQLKQTAGPGSVLRLYVNRTDGEYAKGCAAVGWADIVNGGTDPNRGDVDITFEDTEIEFKLTKKSMELLNNGNLQVVGHGFDLLKITIE